MRQGDAFVCDLSADEVRAYRGTLTEPGRNSPYRDRSVEENLDLLRRMRAGEFPDGARTLRAKIDMAAGNMNLRDPALYRIKHVEHQNTGMDWPIYPMYDFAHSLSDAVEGITHSLCTLEFEDHRPLYDWCVDKVDLANSPELVQPLLDQGPAVRGEQAAPDRILAPELQLPVMSKRKLMALVQAGLVDGWDDPRMPTLQGIRRRGYTPSALRLMVDRVGISKQNSLLDISHPRRRAARRPRRHRAAAHGGDRPAQAGDHQPAGRPRRIADVPNHPKDESVGRAHRCRSRNELWIEREDFEEVPPKGFKRLIPGGEVRLRGAGIFRCDEVIKDGDEVVELRGVLDPESRPGMAGADRKIKGTIHWVSAQARGGRGDPPVRPPVQRRRPGRR